MKSAKISFPLVHKRSSLPTLALFLGVIGAIPILMVMWVAICSDFTRIEGSNETTLYNVYICVRALFAVVTVASLVVYDLRRASVALLPASVLGFVSSAIKLIMALSDYSNKKALADAMSMHPSYTQNYINIAESALFTITALMFLLYLIGIFKTAFPVVFGTVFSTIITLYSLITYSTTYETSEFSVLCKCYGAPLCLGVLLICISSKTRKQLEGSTGKYKPRRMKK